MWNAGQVYLFCFDSEFLTMRKMRGPGRGEIFEVHWKRFLNKVDKHLGPKWNFSPQAWQSRPKTNYVKKTLHKNISSLLHSSAFPSIISSYLSQLLAQNLSPSIDCPTQQPLIRLISQCAFTLTKRSHSKPIVTSPLTLAYKSTYTITSIQ